MPVLHYSDGERQFQITGGCLAVMGRSPAAAENIQNLIEKVELTGVKQVVFKKILQIEPLQSNIKYLELMDKYMSMFPFMRCVLTSNKDILTKGDCAFDVENYSQNEVMHAMFHIRILAYSQISIVYSGDFMIHAMYKLMTEQNLPFWKAYLFVTVPHDKTFSRNFSSVNYLMGGDANTYQLGAIPLSSFISLLKGEQPLPDYVGGTVSQLAKAGRAYTQNISKYMTVTGSRPPTLSQFIVRWCETSQQESGDIGEQLDAFGHRIKRDNKVLNVAMSHIKKALDKTLAFYKISEEGMIC